MKRQHLFLIGLLLGTCIVSSCRKEEEDGVKCMINYDFAISPDLLKFVSPQITYNDQNGTVYTISGEDELNSIVVTRYVETEYSDGTWVKKVIDSTSYSCWSLCLYFNHLDFNSNMEVKYIRKELTEDTDGKSYNFYHSLRRHILVGGSSDSDGIKVSESVDPLDITDFLLFYTGKGVDAYIDNLANSPDRGGFYVDAQGHYTLVHDVSFD